APRPPPPPPCAPWSSNVAVKTPAGTVQRSGAPVCSKLREEAAADGGAAGRTEQVSTAAAWRHGRTLFAGPVAEPVGWLPAQTRTDQARVGPRPSRRAIRTVMIP